MPARLGRRGRHRPGPLGGDKVLVAHRLVGSGEFEHPVEDHPAAPGASAVEAEHDLVFPDINETNVFDNLSKSAISPQPAPAFR